MSPFEFDHDPGGSCHRNPGLAVTDNCRRPSRHAPRGPSMPVTLQKSRIGAPNQIRSSPPQHARNRQGVSCKHTAEKICAR